MSDEFHVTLNNVTDLAVDAGIGSVQIWAGHREKVPEGWLICDGRELDSTDKQYNKLFLVIGTVYGSGLKPRGFKLPNLDMRVVVGSSKTDPAYGVGKTVGQDQQSTTFAPSLSHQRMYDALAVNTENGFETNPVVGANAQTISSDVRQASVVMSYMIKYQE